MSDFTSNFWSLYVTGISLVGIFACLLLLWFSGKAKAMTANDNTTGHVWDGDLREMNNPLPRWWVWPQAAPSIGAPFSHAKTIFIQTCPQGIRFRSLNCPSASTATLK